MINDKSAKRGTDCRRHGSDERCCSHHNPQLFLRHLLHCDVKHQRKGNTGTNTLDQTAQKQQREYRCYSCQDCSNDEQDDCCHK